jgi:pimeloyl-ACP methyl ester carboxylesterase
MTKNNGGYKLKIPKLLKISLAALMLFSVCNQSGADSTALDSSLQAGENPDLRRFVQNLPSGSTTASLLDPCTASNIIRWPLPIYWGQPNSPTFTYAFQIQVATEGDPRTAPIGIVIPGGAGAPSIGYPPGTIFPPTFNVIYTDVRGVGCNINPDNPFTPDALTTEYFSRDVLSIVQVLGLRKYVLFGISYGTVQATVMANIAQNEGIQAPGALILEGIVGNWWINAQEVVDYNKEWTKVKALLPSIVVSNFQTPSPYGISSRDWMTLLTATLNAGTTPQHGNNTAFYLRPLGDPDTMPGAIVTIQNKIAEIKASYTYETVRVATILHCTETTGSVYTKDLVNGEIVDTGPDQCPLWGLSFVHPYDSAQYPVTVPIYYFEGSEDPNTSPANAAYHFSNQTQANRVFTLVWGGGHTDMSGTLHETGCTPAIFTAIATNPSGLGAALQQCHWPMSVAVRAAGQ